MFLDSYPKIKVLEWCLDQTIVLTSDHSYYRSKTYTWSVLMIVRQWNNVFVNQSNCKWPKENFKIQVIHIFLAYFGNIHFGWYWKKIFFQRREDHSLIKSHTIVDKGEPGELESLNSWTFIFHNGISIHVVRYGNITPMGVLKSFHYFMGWAQMIDELVPPLGWAYEISIF